MKINQKFEAYYSLLFHQVIITVQVKMTELRIHTWRDKILR